VEAAELEAKEEDRLIKLAIEESLKPSARSPARKVDIGLRLQRPETLSEVCRSDEEREEDELVLAVEMSLATTQMDDAPGDVSVSLSQRDDTTPSKPSDEAGPSTLDSRSSSPTPPPGTGTASGSVIGRHRFQHDPEMLATHLESTLQYWRGEREPIGVQIAETSRCGWCEFEEGCEWRCVIQRYPVLSHDR
jgi:exonuclease V